MQHVTQIFELYKDKSHMVQTPGLCAVPKFITCAVWKFPYISE